MGLISIQIRIKILVDFCCGYRVFFSHKEKSTIWIFPNMVSIVAYTCNTVVTLDGQRTPYSLTTLIPSDRALPIIHFTTSISGISRKINASSWDFTTAISYICFNVTIPATSWPTRRVKNIYIYYSYNNQSFLAFMTQFLFINPCILKPPACFSFFF